MRFMQTESVLQTKNRSESAKNGFSVALYMTVTSGEELLHYLAELGEMLVTTETK